MIRIGILCPSEIAFRRFLPALRKCEQFQYIGVATASVNEWFGKENKNDEKQKKVILKEQEKAKMFTDNYGGKVFQSYSEMIKDSSIDAIYIPLPPALHFKWASEALKNGKHVLVEKTATTNLSNTEELIRLAGKNNLALHENYMFSFHKQLHEIKKIIDSGELGIVRLYRIDFGFPMRKAGDFRYVKELGGGALLDCGGYTIKYASQLLGGDVRIRCSSLGYNEKIDVDLYGSATLENEKGEVAQVSFGMDNSYRCNLDVWGSEGSLFTGRVLTAPVGYEPMCLIKTAEGEKNIKLSEDDTFAKSLSYFAKCIANKEIRERTYEDIKIQAMLVDDFYIKLKNN